MTLDVEEPTDDGRVRFQLPVRLDEKASGSETVVKIPGTRSSAPCRGASNRTWRR